MSLKRAPEGDAGKLGEDACPYSSMAIVEMDARHGKVRGDN
jgi:hypothetical protein